MRHALFAALIAALATPAVAGGLVVNGQHYHCVADRAANGDVLLNGTSGVDNFHLRVHGNKVVGVVGISDVAFTVSPETVASLDAELSGGAQQAAAIPATLAAN
jgi:hypothetical protein